MPRAIVMLSGDDWKLIKNQLSNMVRKRKNKITDETGVILEFYLEAFGWSDFVLSLWGTNVEMIKKAILLIRESCKAYTTTIIGITAEEKKVRALEFEDKQTTPRTEKGYFSGWRPIKADDVFEEYIALNKGFLKAMEEEIGKKIEPRSVTD